MRGESPKTISNWSTKRKKEERREVKNNKEKTQNDVWVSDNVERCFEPIIYIYEV